MLAITSAQPSRVRRLAICIPGARRYVTYSHLTPVDRHDDDFDKLDPADETHFLPSNFGYGGYGREQTLTLPYYGLRGSIGMGADAGMGSGLGLGGNGIGMVMTPGLGHGNLDQSITTDLVPPGKVSMHRGDPVIATDGEIGRV